ncbi:hypothetical protein HQ587_04900 [bacterium]|nr:hypothetical protein [bacterium]
MKIRVKLGSKEFEYEGSEEYYEKNKQDLLSLISSNTQLSDTSDEEQYEDPTRETTVEPTLTPRAIPQLTTSTIAARLKCKDAYDLILAASAKLIFVDSQDRFNRNELIKEMNSASSHCTKSYTHNLTRYLEKLMSQGNLNEISKDVYCLSQTKLDEMRVTFSSL